MAEEKMPETYFIRRAHIQTELEPEFQWQEDAACRFQPHTLFEIASADDAIAEGIVPDGNDPQNELTDLNVANFERAVQICNTCPVKQTCLDEANPDDFLWTIRGGKLPINFNPNKQGRPPGRYGKVGPNGVRICKNCGEEQAGVKPNGGLFCKPCKYTRTNEAARKRRAAGGEKKGRTAKIVKRGRLCKNNHDEWTERPSRGRAVKFECYRCRRDRDTIAS